MASLLRELDTPAPPLVAGAIVDRAVGDRASVDRARPKERRLLRWAAGVLLAVGIAGGAYAIPGSPLPRWVDAVAEWAGGGRQPSSPPAAVVPEPRVSGIAVAPGRALLILFTWSQNEGHVQVQLTGGAEVMVSAPVGAATFTSREDRLVIDNRGSSATFEIQIPRAAPSVEIRVDRSRIFLKEGPRITPSDSADARGPYVLRLASPGS